MTKKPEAETPPAPARKFDPVAAWLWALFIIATLASVLPLAGTLIK